MELPEKYDSPEEEAFFHWCIEAKEAGIVREFIYQPESIEIIPWKGYIEHKQLKTKVKEIERTLCHPLSYTTDFLVYGHMYQFHRPKSHMLDCYGRDRGQNTGQVATKHTPFYIDIKGNFKDGSKAAKFNLIQKVLYDVKGIYVNRVIPTEFFNIAWMPGNYDSVFEKNFCWTDERNFAKKGFQPARKRKAFEKALTYKEWEDKKWSF